MPTIYCPKGADRCARGGGSLNLVVLVPDREVWERLHCLGDTPLCELCATPEENAAANRRGTCLGCGISIHFSPRTSLTDRWVVCSTRCYQRAWRRPWPRPTKERECAVCRKSFEPTRSDARFCSGACRQLAYRKRLVAQAAD